MHSKTKVILQEMDQGFMIKGKEVSHICAMGIFKKHNITLLW